MTASLLLVALAFSPGEQPSGVPPTDMVCGPRCVQFILEHYGIKEDLIDLVKEIQWPDFEAGASLGAIEAALRKRGIYTCALRMDPKDRLAWSAPVVLHLKGQTAIGHFMVWWPDAAQAFGWEELAGELSGTILLTSSAPIAEPEKAVRKATHWPSVAVIAVFVAALFAAPACRRRAISNSVTRSSP